MLNDQQLAKITNSLQVPAVISDIIDGNSDLSDDVHYALHDVISDLQPDEALLCIALAGRRLSTLSKNETQTLPIMRMECDRIIEEYGSLWLTHANENEIAREEKTLELLDVISEDLEGLNELLEFCSDFVFYEHKIIAELCTILQIQARAHAVIAEEFAKAAAVQSRESIESLSRANSAVSHARKINFMPQAVANANNVIAFPFRPQE